nr:hypothetical protein [Tanacetum cinerariifolium]
MDLLTFIRHSDPTKVQIWERDLAEREVKLLKMTEGRIVSLDPPVTATSGDSGDSIDKLFDEGNDVGQEHSVERDDDVLEETVAKGASKVVAEKTKKWKRKVVGDASGPTFPPKKLREDYHAGASGTGGKSLVTIRELVLDGFSVLSGVTGPHTVVFLAPTPGDRPTNFVSPAMDAPVTTVAVTTMVIADASIVPPPRVRVVSKTLEIVADSTFTDSDAEIVHLKSLLSLKEAEAVEAIHLRGQLNVVEAAGAAKGGELRDLKKKNFALKGEKDVMSEKIVTLESTNAAKEVKLSPFSSQVSKLTSNLYGFQLSRNELDSKIASLESERDCLVTQERMEALQDEQANVLCEKVAELDAQLSEIAIHLDEEFYPRFLTTISGWELSMLVAYDPYAEAKYIDAMNALGAVDFSLLSELESKKDSCIVDLMGSLFLEGTLAEIPGAKNLQPSPEQLMLSIYRSKDDVFIEETSLSSSLQVVHLWVQRFRGEIKEKRLLLTDVITPLVEPLSSKSLTSEASTSAAPITTLSTTFSSSNVVLPTSVVSDQVLDAESHNEDPFAVAFKKEELGTFPE